MNDTTEAFALTSRRAGEPTPALTGVSAQGRLDGVLFGLTLRQTYRNASDQLLEVVYTFPLPVQAVLLGFAAELNGKRQVGTIVPRRQAEQQYEAALAEGDAPVMLEMPGEGLYTANIGNLAPGDEIVLEVRFAQVLAFEQGRLRVSIPTTIAPRYGSAARAGLQPQQVPQASMTAEYPLTLSITLAGAMAGAAVDCPTHRFGRLPVDGGIRLDLDSSARLDRDVVILLQPKEPRPSLVIQAADPFREAAPVVRMATLQPRLVAPRDAVAVKLLVDCSGSMAGDSIASARAALQGVLAGLTDRDRVSLTRFGSSVEHVLVPGDCSPRTLRHLAARVRTIEADMGGTAMGPALWSLFELRVDDSRVGADVLLITDGEIWQADRVVAAAKASGHRVFAIGVGSAPAEDVLRALAEATGGACEFATPGEALEAAAQRMLARIRQQPWRDLRIDWGCETVWHSALPAGVFGGDTVLAFAGTAAGVPASAVRLLATDGSGGVIELARGEADAPCPGDSLPRIAAARRMAGEPPVEVLALAVDYQLMSPQTHCILVHERADAEKLAGQAVLHRVDSMLAAGWGGSSALHSMPLMASQSQRSDRDSMPASGPEYLSMATPSVWRNARARLTADPGASAAAYAVAEVEIPAFLRKQRDVDVPCADTLDAIARTVAEHLAGGGTLEDLAARCAGLDGQAEVRLALDEAVRLGFPGGLAWTLLAHWAVVRVDALDGSALVNAMQPHLQPLGAALVAVGLKRLDEIFGLDGRHNPLPSRADRLQRAMTPDAL